MRFYSGSLALVAAVVVAAPAAAQVITPTGTFGSQPSMTFGGTGIPNSWVMTNTNASILGVLLGLTATPRYTNPGLTNNGAGTFYGLPGVDANSPSTPANPYATWNFDWFIGGANAANYTYRLYYDFDPAVGNTQANEGYFGAPYLSPGQNSWNLGMGFLELPLPQAPAYAEFDPNLPGEYTFALVAYDANLQEAGRAAIAVDTAVTPEPASMTLLATGLVGLVGFRRRKKRPQ